MPVELNPPILGSIVTNTGQVAAPVQEINAATIFVALTGVTAGVFNFEGSLDSTDGVNGNWFPVTAVRTNSGIANIQEQLSATPAFAWQVNLACINYLRVRASSGTFGTAAFQIVTSATDIFEGLLAATVQGAIPSGSNLGATQPVFVGGRTTLANATARTDGQMSPFTMDGQGRLIVKPYSTNELDWQAFNANASPINTATVTTLKGAIATYRQYVTAIQLINTSATPGEIILQDATGTPVQMWHMWLPASMTMPLVVEFPTPLRTGSGTASAVNLNTLTAGMSIYWSVQGFIGY
jgi:hypothetical protein